MRPTTLAPQLSGYLSAVEVVDFQTVKKGELIARIDDRSYREKLAQAEATLATARAALKVGAQTVASAEAVRQSGLQPVPAVDQRDRRGGVALLVGVPHIGSARGREVKGRQ